MSRADLMALDKAALADLVLRQAERIAALEARLAGMERRFEELERRAARGAAPFARPEGKRSASLNKGLGLTTRKTCAVLRDLLGIELSPGGLAQALARVAGRLAPAYDALLESVRAEPVLHTDETSWWVGRAGFSLWVLTNRAG